MRIDWDAPIAMDHGLVLRADVFRPEGEGRWPVILSYAGYPAHGCRTSRASCAAAGPFLREGPRDRPASVFGGTPTLHPQDSYVLIPVIP